MKNKMSDLRNHLFETLEALKDKDEPMDLERANAIGNIGKVLIESAKVEVSFLKIVGEREGEAEFFDAPRNKQLGTGR